MAGVSWPCASPGGSLSFLFQDQVNSAIYATDAYGNKLGSRGDFSLGAARFSKGALPTDRTFTSQQEDGTGKALQDFTPQPALTI